MPKGKNRQLTLEDRIFIEDRIKARDSLSEAARRLGVSASTVSCEISEIKRNRVPESPGYQVAQEDLCRKAAECTVAGPRGTGCLAPCRKCRKGPSACSRGEREGFQHMLIVRKNSLLLLPFPGTYSPAPGLCMKLCQTKGTSHFKFG